MALTSAAVACAVYWRTAYPSITWWDSSSYSTAAVTLGVLSPPGSLAMTLLGWLVTRIPWPAPPAATLNLLAGTVAATIVFLVAQIAFLLTRRGPAASRDPRDAGLLAVLLASLAFGFSPTLWEHAIKFTPYGLSALFTGLMLLVLVRWWDTADDDGAGWPWIALFGLLLGLDFSVHRTNALLVPGALAWVLVRRPGVLVRWRAWAGGAIGLLSGLALQLLLIPISRTTRSPINMFPPVDLRSLWDYVALPNSGGTFLVDVFPRKSPLWSVQVADLLRTFRLDFASVDGPLGWLGIVPLVLGVAGLIALWRRERRLGVAFTLLLVLHAATTVLYFNIPADYFRPFDRHYLPVFVVFAVATAIGARALVLGAIRTFAAPMPRLAAAAMVGIAPMVQLTTHWAGHDASGRWFTRDYAENALQGLPRNAVYFTVGDNDTFPVWYAQAVEGVRPDVRIINLGMASTTWFPEQLRRAHPTLPLTPGQDARQAANARAWQDRMLVIPIGTDTLRTAIRPLYGDARTPADEVLVDLLRQNAFRDPVTYALTVGDLAWLSRLARIEGAYQRVVPDTSPAIDASILRENLLHRYRYRGFADASILVDPSTRVVAAGYVAALQALLDADAATGALDQCRADRAAFVAMVPIERLQLDAGTQRSIEQACR